MKKFLVALGYFFLAVPAHAVSWGSCVVQEAATIQCIVPLFTNLVQGVLALSGVALFVMLVVGGYNFLLSGGDPKKLEAARGTLTNAVIGLVVIVCAFLIIKTIEVATGVPVTKFELNF